MTLLKAIAIASAVVLFASAGVFANALSVRYERDVTRMVFNDNLEALREAHRRSGVAADSLAQVLAMTPQPPADRPYIVVSIEDHQLWYRQGDSVLFSAPVGTGSGKVLEGTGEDLHWRFETPRGRLTVVAKDTAPMWVAPDWHYVEVAQARGYGVRRLERGQAIRTDSAVIRVDGSDVVRVGPDGKSTRVGSGEGNELVVDGNIVIPPFGTNQRKFAGVLGAYRLLLGDGYAIHGTDKPETIGHSVSHGCVRMTNQDIAKLYALVPIGTPVFIY